MSDQRIAGARRSLEHRAARDTRLVWRTASDEGLLMGTWVDADDDRPFRFAISRQLHAVIFAGALQSVGAQAAFSPFMTMPLGFDAGVDLTPITMIRLPAGGIPVGGQAWLNTNGQLLDASTGAADGDVVYFDSAEYVIA